MEIVREGPFEQANQIKLISERKRGVRANYLPPPLEPEVDEGDELIATINGMDIVVKEPRHAQRICSMGNFGTFVGQRMNFANNQCFAVQEASTSTSLSMMEQVSIQSNETITSIEQVYEREELSKNAKNPDAAAWIEKVTSHGWLHLSPVEAFYLKHDLGAIKINGFAVPTKSSELFNLFLSTFGTAFGRRYQVYKYFRQLGWVVRDGINFGVDFLLYKDSVELHHACAGVRIIRMTDPVITDPSLIAAQRELGNCKKRLLLASVEFLVPEEKIRLEDLELARVHVISMNYWTPDRNRTADLELA